MDHVWTIRNVTSFSIAPGFVLAKLEDGNIMAWGRNDHGQLGVPSSGFDDFRISPVRVEFR